MWRRLPHLVATTPLTWTLLACWLIGMAASGVLSFEIHGKVQGVFFRKHTQAQGAKLGLRGWCENTRTGTVRGMAHGDAASIEKFKHWLAHTGSPKSRIDKTDFAEIDKDPATLQKPFAIVK